MDRIEFTSEITVELIDWAANGSDLSVCRSAWVSSLSQRIDSPSDEQVRGLINTLMKQRHGSPFESGYFEFWIDAPRAVRDEHVRHRIGSFSSSSLRYNHGSKPRLYIPSPQRPLEPIDGFKKMRPAYTPYSEEKYERYCKRLQEAYAATYAVYFEMVEEGFTGTEDTRWITHDGKMTPYIARFNPRSLMAFLSLRTHSSNANHVSYPMWEIEYIAREMEKVFAEKYPYTYEAFNTYGREAP